MSSALGVDLGSVQPKAELHKLLLYGQGSQYVTFRIIAELLLIVSKFSPACRVSMCYFLVDHFHDISRAAPRRALACSVR